MHASASLAFALIWGCAPESTLQLCSSCRYPHGYTLVFVSAHSPYYTGNHWAIYDSSNDFYGYDDNDLTAGETSIPKCMASTVIAMSSWAAN